MGRGGRFRCKLCGYTASNRFAVCTHITYSHGRRTRGRNLDDEWEEVDSWEDDAPKDQNDDDRGSSNQEGDKMDITIKDINIDNHDEVAKSTHNAEKNGNIAEIENDGKCKRPDTHRDQTKAKPKPALRTNGYGKRMKLKAKKPTVKVVVEDILGTGLEKMLNDVAPVVPLPEMEDTNVDVMSVTEVDKAVMAVENPHDDSESTDVGLCEEIGETLCLPQPGKKRRHRLTNNPLYACPHCGRCHSSGWNLTLHIRTHTGEKPFMCPTEGCGLTFKSKQRLQIHISSKGGCDRVLKRMNTDSHDSQLSKLPDLQKLEKPLKLPKLANPLKLQKFVRPVPIIPKISQVDESTVATNSDAIKSMAKVAVKADQVKPPIAIRTYLQAAKRTIPAKPNPVLVPVRVPVRSPIPALIRMQSQIQVGVPVKVQLLTQAKAQLSTQVLQPSIQDRSPVLPQMRHPAVFQVRAPIPVQSPRAMLPSVVRPLIQGQLQQPLIRFQSKPAIVVQTTALPISVPSRFAGPVQPESELGVPTKPIPLVVIDDEDDVLLDSANEAYNRSESPPLFPTVISVKSLYVPPTNQQYELPNQEQISISMNMDGFVGPQFEPYVPRILARNLQLKSPTRTLHLPTVVRITEADGDDNDKTERRMILSVPSPNSTSTLQLNHPRTFTVSATDIKPAPVIALTSTPNPAVSKTITTYKCSLCPEVFTQRAAHFTHSKGHGTKYACKYCAGGFNTYKGVKAHTYRTHPCARGAFQCPICSRHYDSEFILSTHLARMHRDETGSKSKREALVANAAKFSFNAGRIKSPSNEVVRRAVGPRPSQPVLPKSEEPFPPRPAESPPSRLEQPTLTSSPSKIAVTSIEDELEEFLLPLEDIEESNLKTPNKNENEVRPLNEDPLGNIRQKLFSSEDNTPIPTLPSPAFKCDQCGSSLHSQKGLLMHINIVHGGARPPPLAPVFESKPPLASVTNGNQPNRQPTTPTSPHQHFSSLLHLFETETNDGATYFPCPECNEYFKLKRNLINHIKRVHPDIRMDNWFKCDHCSSWASSLIEIQEHTRFAHCFEEDNDAIVVEQDELDIEDNWLITEEY